MILRVAAGLSLALGVSLLFGFFYWIGESPLNAGPERHLRAMKERMTAPDSIVPSTFGDFAALPHGRPVAEFEGLEKRGIALVGWVKDMALPSDGDYHMSLTETPPPPLNVVSPTITAELTPEWRRGSTNWQWERLETALRPYSWVDPDWPGGPRKVRISGWLMYDFQYDEPFVKNKRPRLPGQTYTRITGWEIHPVTRIELWDDSLSAFVEYPR